MKKFLFLLFAMFLIFGGIYGAYYLINLEKAETLINRSIRYIQEENYKDATDLLNDVAVRFDYPVVKSPTLYLLAETYEREQDYKTAVAIHTTLITTERLTSSNWSLKSIIAVSRIYRKNLIKSPMSQIEVLEKYIEVINDEIKAKRWSTRTGLNRLISDLKRALQSMLLLNYNLNVSMPSDREILTELETELGFLYLQTERYDEAKRIFKDLKTTRAQFGLAQVYLQSGHGSPEYEKGISLLEDLIQYDATGNILAYYLKELFSSAQYLYKKKRYSEAIVLFQKIVRHSQNTDYSELSLFYLAQYYYQIKNSSKALTYVDILLRNSIYTKDEEAWLLKGYIYYDRRDFVQALRVFNDFIKRFPKSKDVQLARQWKSMCERSIKYLG